MSESHWLALMIGNSRLHWAWFVEEALQFAWDTEYLPVSVVQNLASCQNIADFSREILAPGTINMRSLPPIYLASVIPQATTIWQTYPNIHEITLDQVPLQGVYATLGIDRALALWGAGAIWSFPALVIDAGTALTFTGAKCDRTLVGGAILPGVRLQLQSLGERTAALPLVDTPESFPSRWALNTPESILSGVIYTLMAGIKDFVDAWWQEFPESCVAMTGGDRALLLNYFQVQYPNIATKITSAPHLIFQGMCCYWASRWK
ncbi:pantothenate kinase [Gloeocapsopsis crepidinum LEGE 06123]|uniref:Type III pantothenate kinase n=1 Tax=Gloeocapsopsis crepidinum LEGE 06123 TaxID=588587 RepID=A0ABR9UT86_9CHRO|nr:pantothenate kinase [Gloeocapsopsis crepidinum]MBE9191505.1 pantothenate kinase [Gloeocapsopsis crepidinum LEGE 06123]